ncbi:tRNA (adenosine(37)-N6)-threonylcarbamoyltransferase complex dimerization subunit type 1 TsaB [Luteimonas sp. FCS-9]|uniref:tRNA (adenosine(37)-N6)-threonylcarbamoyltransferase complex dimerization subunit type 1 TsaB n=1 Tax=Luteimonas sp. FCS-9 TaxID=1547516 RepID=UPI00063EAE9C|nr:tRNA (adenosine(37)-N6)-threonylcarbamoyltransferase complex dimerization subunit type 1 TsaB [Luteimonas sp. FCS-9]KLI99611.1 glycoprotease [Luteimonas sp. FCS-9]
MKLLAFETATEACSVAVWDHGRVLQRFEVAPRRHAELALPWAEALLAEAGIARSQLDAVAVSRGPGAFTGVRLGIALAQGVALALDRPVVAASTLAVLALRAHAGEGAPVLAAIDARMGEVYRAAFAMGADGPVATSDERVGAPDAVELPGTGDAWHGVGTGFGVADGLLAARLGADAARIDATALPHAADLAALAAAAYERGEAVVPERLEPAYLRNDVALTLAQQQARRAAR